MTRSPMGPVASALFLLSAHIVIGQSRSSDPIRVQDVAFVRPGGAKFTLAEDLARGPVVLLFMRGFTGGFACFYCGEQTRSFAAGYTKVRSAGAEVVMVLPGASEVAGFLREVGSADPDHPDPKFAVPFTVLLDPDGTASRAFDVPYQASPDGVFPVSSPATIVIAKDGKILFSHHGKDPSDRATLEDVLGVLSGAFSTDDPSLLGVTAAGAIPGTAFALLFLTRATRQIMGSR